MLTEEQRVFLFPRAYNAALRAGAGILDLYRKGTEGKQINIKKDDSPLIEADCKAHSVIKEYLGRTHVPVLSEEGREMLYDERRNWELFWMVDPLDGTKEFIKGNGEFTVNIALIENNIPVMSVLYVPYIGKMYIADRTKGLSLVKEGIFPDPKAEYDIEDVFAGTVKLPLATAINRPLRIGISRSHNNEETYKAVELIKTKYPDAEVIEQGSSYKLCLLAEGAIDCYVRTSPTYEWDTAAGELILELSGGSLTTYPDRQKLTYNQESLQNPSFFCRSRFMPEIG